MAGCKLTSPRSKGDTDKGLLGNNEIIVNSLAHSKTSTVSLLLSSAMATTTTTGSRSWGTLPPPFVASDLTASNASSAEAGGTAEPSNLRTARAKAVCKWLALRLLRFALQADRSECRRLAGDDCFTNRLLSLTVTPSTAAENSVAGAASAEAARCLQRLATSNRAVAVPGTAAAPAAAAAAASFGDCAAITEETIASAALQSAREASGALPASSARLTHIAAPPSRASGPDTLRRTPPSLAPADASDDRASWSKETKSESPQDDNPQQLTSPSSRSSSRRSARITHQEGNASSLSTGARSASTTWSRAVLLMRGAARKSNDR
eukprot:GHVT01000533.1.p1 GENE.GHVT01000533.1~~GHVT01000533.1.p1  ORF type:complete len:323 (+),score=69.35 GHVT01000533.1:637-1605(+)